MQRATAVVETRLDVRLIASLAKAYTNAGVLISSRSQLLAMALEDLTKTLIERGKTEEFLSTTEAFSYLASRGLRIASDRGNRSAISAAIGAELSEVIESRTDDHVPVSAIDRISQLMNKEESE